VDEVVAVVNNSVITRRELLDRADEIESQLRAANRRCRRGPTCSAKCSNAW
jgi:peptidyl-prolyl cis-trans isomerase SurA